MLLVRGPHSKNHWTQGSRCKESLHCSVKESPVRSHTCPSTEDLMHAPGSLKSLVPGHCSIDGFISFYYLTSFLPWIHSVWLLILLTNVALVSLILPRIGPLIWNMLFSFQLWPWLLTTQTAFPAWLCCLRSRPLNPPWPATASQGSPTWHYLMPSAKSPMTYLQHGKDKLLGSQTRASTCPLKS